MEEFKRAAAERAVKDYVESGMVVGLGTGSTAECAVRAIAERLHRGEYDGHQEDDSVGAEVNACRGGARKRHDTRSGSKKATLRMS